MAGDVPANASKPVEDVTRAVQTAERYPAIAHSSTRYFTTNNFEAKLDVYMPQRRW
jgi:hypothetical protein